GRDIVAFYHGPEAAEQAAQRWLAEVSRGQDAAEIPEAELPRVELTDGGIWVCQLLVKLGLAKSNNEARRAIEGGAGAPGPERQRVFDTKAQLSVADGLIVRNGKQKVVKVRLT